MRKAGIFILIIGFIFALGWAYYFLYHQTDVGVTLQFVKPDEVLVGQPFTLSVSFSNPSDKVLGNAQLSLVLPQNVSFAGEDSSTRVRQQLVGDLGPGSVNQQSFDLIVTNGAQSLQHIEAHLKYQIGTSSSDFESQNAIDLAVGQPVATFTLSTPQSVYSGQNFTVTAAYTNNSNNDLKNVHLVLNYPPSFQFGKASTTPDIGNDEWDFPVIRKGETGTITFSGTLTAPDTSSVTMTGDLTSDYLGQKYTINSQTATISIATPPLELDITAGNDPNFVAHIGDTTAYTLHYKNNSSSTLNNVSIQATLSGQLFDFHTLQSDGSFNSLSDVVTWNAANTPELQLLPPGGEGTVTMGVSLLKAFPATRISDKNFTLHVKGQISSPTVPEGTTANATLSATDLTTKVGGELDLATLGFFRDAASGILNTGPFPPRVNHPTQYTIHWRLRNYATDLSNVRISAFLQSGAKFTGKVKSTLGDGGPTYNANSGEVVWTIPSLAATKGVVGSPLEAIFQIEQTPSSNQLGSQIPLVSEAKFTAQDTFTGLTLSGTVDAITTALPDDQNLPFDHSVTQ